jgi:integrase
MSTKVRARYQTYTRKDGSIAYVVNTRDLDGRKIRRVFDFLRDADEFRDKMKRERRRLHLGMDMPITEIRAREYFDQWLARRKDLVPLSTYRGDEQRVRFYLKPAFGYLILSRINTGQVERFLSDLIPKYKISVRTRNIIRQLLGQIFADAIRLRYANFNPVKETTRIQETDEKWDYWRSESEIETFLTAASQDSAEWFYPLVSLLLQTGVRVGEALALRWDEDLSLEEGWAIIGRTYERASKSVVERVKGKKSRSVGINESLKQVLQDYRERRSKRLTRSGMPLFTWETGTIVDPKHVRLVHTRVCSRAGVRRIRVHDLRHQYASLFVKRKGNLYTLQKLLGHTSTEMTQRYSHLDPAFLREQASVVEFKPVSVKNDAANLEQNASTRKSGRRRITWKNQKLK